MKTTAFGGNRLGSGNNRTAELRTFERSTHNLDYVWRSTMAPGVLVPFMVEIALPGDTFDIELASKVMTHPTIGPLLGSFKAQFDIFEVPIRNYQAQLHNNKLGIGMEMSSIKLPQLWLKAKNLKPTDISTADGTFKDIDNWQIEPSHILSYLGIRGLGQRADAATKPNEQHWIDRKFDATPFIGYYDIMKNYYANKQEGRGFYINKPIPITILVRFTNPSLTLQLYNENNVPSASTTVTKDQTQLTITSPKNTEDLLNAVKKTKYWYKTNGEDQYITAEQLGNAWVYDNTNKYYSTTAKVTISAQWKGYENNIGTQETKPELKQFDLRDVDNMREEILLDIKNANAFHIALDATELPSLYTEQITGTETGGGTANGIWYSKLNNTMQGLCVKTYQSDIFNNWLDEDWITGGEKSIAELSKMTVELVDGQQTQAFLYVDEMIIKRKVYEMLNDIAVSGGSYNDWINAVYDHEGRLNSEIPIYCGGLSKEIVFDEIVSNAGTEGEPLGTLAGRGNYNGKHKGGKVTIKVNEPSYIMGIVSLTPRVDYSQGNRWFTDLKTMDDFHKPHLDQIGFQDLITDTMFWADTEIEGNISEGQTITKYSVGKIPAWSNYMTNFNRTYGNFAKANNQMFMTLNRRYVIGDGGENDFTTYINPAKYNYIFADAKIDAQNFWMQIGVNMTKRTKMSAKVMPH
ncbi:MAG: major capsid protein [Microviridae sp.]|nr:MAG: major capsid protein [Microviridae sp.]